VRVLTDVLDARATGRTVVATELVEARALKTRAHPLSELEGRVIRSAARYGKHVDLDVGDADGGELHLVVSLGRAGWVVWTEPRSSPEAGLPVIARLELDDGSVLSVIDQADWLSLGLSVVESPAEVASIAKLGPDPLGPNAISPPFSREAFDAVVSARRKQVKALLQEQETFAGIGNAYSDEILHVARISPVVHASALSEEERDRLFDAVVGVLADAYAARQGVPIDQLKATKKASMRVHGRTGEACPVCGGTVLDIPGTKGGAQYCPTCQTGGVPLG
jgi:formamidopyrimidine-DNA glycosylase